MNCQKLFGILTKDIIGHEHIKRLFGIKITRNESHTPIQLAVSLKKQEKSNGMYLLTSFGEVVHEARQLIESAIKDYWKFKAIDAIRFELPKKERESLIDSQEIRELLSRDTRSLLAKQNEKRSTGSN
ncbi:MAG: hypothetical protein M3044_14635 [Thermoproteota archaeon]|nr:hypothetical protein [Thermoproteota archaeon]